MKIVTIVGARPQFIKAAAVSRELRKKHTEILVHTGQHYDKKMSDIFFEELDIPKPDYNLKIGSSTHAIQTGEMMVGIERVLLKEKPDYIMVYGDTNSTLAGAIAASKLLIPIIHIEAGLRSFNLNMPEEQNRVLTDRISKYLFCPSDTSVKNLFNENIKENVYNIGDVMCDAVLYYSKKIQYNKPEYYFNKFIGLFSNVELGYNKWYLATIHRAENTDSISKLEEILKAFESLKYKVIFPVHPRIRVFIEELYSKYKYKNIIFIEPIGYIEMLYLTKNSEKVITDSGGLQKEAYILKVPCITLRKETEWIETLKDNCNVLCDINSDDIIDKVQNTIINKNWIENYYGNGDSAKKICYILSKKG